jgi:hypothetical protein
MAAGMHRHLAPSSIYRAIRVLEQATSNLAVSESFDALCTLLAV